MRRLKSPQLPIPLSSLSPHWQSSPRTKMADPSETEKLNGVYVEMTETGEEDATYESNQRNFRQETLYGVLHRLLSTILFPDPNNTSASTSLLHRIKISFYENVPLLPDASRNTMNNLLRWTRRGSPLRALLVISVGTITLLTLTGLLVFMLFFVAATVNAIVISLLISLAAAGGFLAIFFACLTAIYIGALSIAAFVISIATISAVIAAVVATGWIGFFWTVWLATKTSVGLAKHSLSVTGSALSAYSSSRHVRRHHHHNEPDKGSD